jgi:hypothetical protein
MRIDQSGQFFTVHFEKGPTLRLKLEDKWRGGERWAVSVDVAGWGPVDADVQRADFSE